MLSTSSPSAIGADARRVSKRRTAALACAATVVAALLVWFAALRGGSPRAYHAALHGTALAPDARGSVDLQRSEDGYRVTLATHGLRQLAPGEFYQAWLANDAGAVAIGSFGSRDVHVALWSGVSPQGFPRITITIETADGDQVPSPQHVLTGVAREG